MAHRKFFKVTVFVCLIFVFMELSSFLQES